MEDFVPYFLNEESIEKEKKSLGAEKVYKSIHSRINVKLQTFLGAFDIQDFGETSAEKLVIAGFNTLEKFLNATESDIEQVYGFAKITAKNIVEGLKENAEEMRYLVENKIINIENSSEGIFTGKSFCFTGELSIKRSDAEKLVKDNGGSVKSSVTKDLSYLVTNDTSSGSSKNQKATKFGIPVIDEKQFFEMLNKS